MIVLSLSGQNSMKRNLTKVNECLSIVCIYVIMYNTKHQLIVAILLKKLNSIQNTKSTKHCVYNMYSPQKEFNVCSYQKCSLCQYINTQSIVYDSLSLYILLYITIIYTKYMFHSLFTFSLFFKWLTV